MDIFACETFVLVCYHQDSVRPGGSLVLLRGLLRSVCVSLGKKLENLILVLDFEDREALNLDAVVRILPELKTLRCWHDEVPDLLVVNLQE